MLAGNYTISDLIGAFCAVFLFVPFLLVPGYVAGWAFDCFGFRGLSVPWRLLVSIPLSVALCPIVIFLLGSTFSWAAVWAFYALILAMCIALFAGAWGHERLSNWVVSLRSTPRVSWVIAATWLVIVLFSLVDLQIGPRLYYSVVAYDYSVRAAITDAITRTGARPANPFYFLTGPVPLRYHYFWFLACSLVDRLGGQVVDARQAMIGSAVWSGWALIAMVPLYFRFLFGWTGAALRRRSLLAIGMFAVTGLDLLPTIYLALKGIVWAHMEWWNEHEVTSWWGTGLWVPHHTSALVIGLIAFLLIWHAASRSTIAERLTGSALAALALATLVGTSIDVAFVFAVFLSIWTVVTWIKGERRQTAVLIVAGLLTTILSLPYLKGLAGPGFGGPFIRPAIRHFSPVDDWAHAAHLSEMKIVLLRVLFLPLNYFLEFGFFLIVAVAYLRLLRKRRSLPLPTLAVLLLAGTSTFLCTFFRSGVITNNDLGFRGFLPTQFVLLLWAAELFAERGEQAQSRQASFHSWWLRSAIWMPVICLGLAGTAYEIGILRFDGVLADLGVVPLGLSTDRHLGRRTYALRTSYDELRHRLPADAIIEDNPETVYDFAYGLYADRQMAAYGLHCGAEFGGDPKICADLFPALTSIFAGPPDLNGKQIEAICKRAHIDAIVLEDLDKAWQNPRSWAWRMRPIISTNYARVYLFTRTVGPAQLNMTARQGKTGNF